MTLAIYLIILIQGFLLLFMFFVAYMSYRGVTGVPWIRSRTIYSKAMLELAQIKPGERIVDFGSGDGSIVIHAAKQYGATGIGYEHLGSLVLLSRMHARFKRVSDRVEFRRKNFLNEEKLPSADVICTYLFPEVNKKLERLLIRDYPSGTRVVSRTFQFHVLKFIASKNVNHETIYLYHLP